MILFVLSIRNKVLIIMFSNIARAALVGAFSLMTGAAIADEARTPANFYAGVLGGVGFGTATQTSTFGGLSNTVDMVGGLFGALVGYRFNAGQIVFGAEADASWSGISGTSPAAAGKTCFVSLPDCHQSIQALLTARGFIGFNHQQFTPYVTAGLALANVVENTGNAITDVQGWQPGIAVGGGVDVAVQDGWSVRGEYLFTAVGSNSISFSGPTTNTNTLNANHIFRLAVTKDLL